MKKNGSTLIETLISLTLCSLVLLAVFEVFGLVRKFFLDLKKNEEDRLAAMACLDKMRIDLLHAGAGLSLPIQWGTVEGFSEDGKNLVVISLEESYSLASDLPVGANQVLLDTTAEISPGREICLVDGQKSERHAVSSCPNKKALILSSPLEHSYLRDESQVFLLEKVSLYFDEEKGLIRRRVNSSSPQPLLEDVGTFNFLCEKEKNLVAVRFGLKSHQEEIYELLVFPKNTALVWPRFE